MGKRIRAQRKGSSPRYRVSSHRFPGANRMPREMDVVGEVTELVHSPVHTAPLARVKLPDGDTTPSVATTSVVSQSVAKSPLETMSHCGLETLHHFRKFLKEQPSTMSNFDQVTVAKLPVLQETPVLSKPSLATRSVFECHPVPSRNFQAPVEPPSVCSPVTAVMRCLCELQVLLTTRLRLVVNSSRMLAVLP